MSKLLIWMCLLPIGLWSQEQPFAFKQRLASMYSQTVPLIYPEQLKELSMKPGVVVLDTRSPAEYKVSHLPGARFVNYDHFSGTDVASIPRTSTIVVYCTVGYRSERIGEKLISMGYQDVRNLYGGIIAYSNCSLPLVDNHQKSTLKVHTWSKEWSAYLEKGIACYE